MGAGWPPVGRSQVEREKHLGSLIAGQKNQTGEPREGLALSVACGKVGEAFLPFEFFGWRVGV